MRDDDGAGEQDADRGEDVSIDEDCGECNDKGDVAGAAAFCPEHGAGGDGDHEQLGIVLEVIGGQHGERGGRGKTDPDSRAGGA